MEFEVVTDVTDVEVIARGVSVRQRARLNRLYGRGRWRKMKGFALVELVSTRRQRPAELHWFEAHGIGARERKIKRFLDWMMKKSQRRRFVVCVKADAGIDLELRKVYEVLPDESAARDDFIRVIDESGEDYLYPASYFVPVDVSEESAQTLHDTTQSRTGTVG